MSKTKNPSKAPSKAAPASPAEPWSRPGIADGKPTVLTKADLWDLGPYHAFRTERYHRHAVPYQIMEGEFLLYHSAHRRQTLDDVIAEELEELEGVEIEHDMAIWHGERLVAAIFRGPDGKPVARKFYKDE
jgi:hypothetical protein